MNWFLFPAISLKIKWNNVEGVQCVMYTPTIFEATQRETEKRDNKDEEIWIRSGCSTFAVTIAVNFFSGVYLCVCVVA